jgi:site-specific recombinase XerD
MPKTELPRGCHIGKMSVHPRNWDNDQAEVSIEWYIHYRFHDPRFKAQHPKGFLVIVKGDMNASKKLTDRQRIAKRILENERANLAKGFNPHGLEESEFEISPTAEFAGALQKAYMLLPETITKTKIGKALVHIQAAISQLRYHQIPVAEIRQRHLEVLLLKIARNKEEEYDRQRSLPKNQGKRIPAGWGPEAFNSYRAYLQILFKQLKRLGATEVKPVEDIEKRKGVKKLRIGITRETFDKINEHLKPNYYTFYRLIHMFFPSGARETEFMGIQKEHVDLAGQRFRVLVKKGKGSWSWAWKTITPKAMPLWEEIMQEAAADQYLFSEDLLPGAVRISARQLTIRWRKHVKAKLGIEADFYELKHTFTTKVITMALKKIDDASKVAAGINNHTSTAMEKQTYDLEAGERLHRELASSTAGLQ